MSIGLRMKQLRERTTLSQRQLGSILGISDTMISAYEKEKSDPTSKNIAKYITHFKADANWLLTGTESNIMSNQEQTLLNLFRYLDDNGKSRVLERAEMLLEEYRKTIIAHEGKLSM